MTVQDTSLEAYESKKSQFPNIEARVLKHLALSGKATCEELEHTLRMPHQTVSARLTKLKQDGVIEDSGERGKTLSGRKAIKWKISNITYAAKYAITNAEQLKLAFME
jgi:predicted HTH transcriptional regulator